MMKRLLAALAAGLLSCAVLLGATVVPLLQQDSATGVLSVLNLSGVYVSLASYLGAISNTNPIQISSATTITNSAKGLTVNAVGGASYTITFNNSGYDADFSTRVCDNDTRGKFLTLTGVGSRRIWPSQCVTVRNQNGALNMSPQHERWAQNTPQIYVDPAGNDTNDCLAPTSGACLTITAAATILMHEIDPLGGFPQINIGCGTYTESVSFIGAPFATSVYFVVGASPGCVTWNPGYGLAYDMQIGDYGSIEAQNITWGHLNGNATFFVDINMHQYAILDVLSGNNFTGVPNAGYLIGSDDLSVVNIDAPITISGNASVMFNIGPKSVMTFVGNITNTITNTPACTTFFATAGGFINLATGVVWSGALTAGCQKWAVTFNGALATAGSTVPGSLAGAPVSTSTPNGGTVN